MHPRTIIVGLWVAWAISWFAAALWSGRTEKRASMGSQAPYRITMVLGCVALAVRAYGYEGALRLWHIGGIGVTVCIALIAMGIAFAWWARLHLGKLWSGHITRKADHRVVDSGPYGIVRHPIYTGLLLAIFATAAAKGTVLGVLGAAILTLGVWMKARVEERWLETELGADAYATYRRRVPMLVPFGPTEGPRR